MDLFIRCYSSSKIFRTYQALTLRVHIHVNKSEEEELAIVNTSFLAEEHRPFYIRVRS